MKSKLDIASWDLSDLYPSIESEEIVLYLNKIKEQISFGQRAYIVLPLIEESEKLDLRSAVETHSQLSLNIFPYPLLKRCP